MKHIKTYEVKLKFEELYPIGELYKIYPTKDPKEEIVIAKYISIDEDGWSTFQGYCIDYNVYIFVPTYEKPISYIKKRDDYKSDEKIGKKWQESLYLPNWRPYIDTPTKEEIEKYEFYDSVKNYNL